MANAVIDVYDQELSPTVQSLTDEGDNRAPFVHEDILWVGTSAIADGSTYRLELRQFGAIGGHEITTTPNPNVVTALQLNDIDAFIGSIARLENGEILFQIKASVEADCSVYNWNGTTLEQEDAPSLGVNTPILIRLNEEVFACYESAIRKRDAADTWANASVTPAPTSYDVRGAHQLGNTIYFLVDTNYSGTTKAEVWKYTTGDTSITLEKTYTGVSAASWNQTYLAGGKFAGALYGCWNDSGSVHTIVKTTGDGVWSDVKTGTRIGQFIEYRGSIFGQYDTTLYSPGTDPTGTWSTISSTFNTHLVVF